MEFFGGKYFGSDEFYEGSYYYGTYFFGGPFFDGGFFQQAVVSTDNHDGDHDRELRKRWAKRIEDRVRLRTQLEELMFGPQAVEAQEIASPYIKPYKAPEMPEVEWTRMLKDISTVIKLMQLKDSKDDDDDDFMMMIH